MRKRLFLKFFILITLVVGISTATMVLLTRRGPDAPALSGTNNTVLRNLPIELLEAGGISLLAGLVTALIAAESVARRLRKMVVFADEIAAGNLSTRLSDSGSDEIATLAVALDKTAGRLEKNFRNLEASRQQLETLLNSMEDAVVAVSVKREVVWFNGAMKRLAASSISVGTPLVRAVRDPDFLRVVGDVLEQQSPQSVTLFSIAPGRTFGMTSALLPDGGAVCVLRGAEFSDRTLRGAL